MDSLDSPLLPPLRKPCMLRFMHLDAEASPSCARGAKIDLGAMMHESFVQARYRTQISKRSSAGRRLASSVELSRPALNIKIISKSVRKVLKL